MTDDGTEGESTEPAREASNGAASSMAAAPDPHGLGPGVVDTWVRSVDVDPPRSAAAGPTPAGRSPGPAGGSTDGEGRPQADRGESGTVALVGAGPGDPDLLTRRAWKRLSAADVVLHDSLADERIVDELPDLVEVVDVGKRPPGRTSQAEINEMMVERAGRGERVVRLKGGDPNVFGRGGEEAEYLAEADVHFEYVPGVSSVLAAPGVSGIPLTHRERASSVTVITGHETPEKAESALDWDALADTLAAGGTLVILMGVRRLPDNVRALRDRGVPADTPSATIQKATWQDERTVVGPLSEIVEKCRAAEVEPPAVTVVGDVVDVHGKVAEQLLR